MVSYVKQAPRPQNETDPEVRNRVSELLEEIGQGGEERARQLAEQFDDWTGPIVLDAAAMDAAVDELDPQVIADIDHAHNHIRTFAEAQLHSISDFTMEVAPGLTAGQQTVPVQVAGCYVPAGRYAHIASALMSVTTASVAGVDNVIVSSPATGARGGVHPAIVHAARVAGADQIIGLGGVQGIAALAFGLFTDLPADIIVGPGNSFVAEAKRQLFGKVGIDVVAGPTESMIVADETADPQTVAIDLIGQAEHGPTSPVWLVTTSSPLAEAVSERILGVAAALPDPAKMAATAAWSNHGEIIIADSREEAAAVCDEYAPEHLQVMAADLDWWRTRLRNYGSLFLGPAATVTFGDKTSGPNHILPTGRAARYTGGLNALTFTKQLTWQRLTAEAGAAEGPIAARISRYEGMEGHARSADVRADAQPGTQAGTQSGTPSGTQPAVTEPGA